MANPMIIRYIYIYICVCVLINIHISKIHGIYIYILNVYIGIYNPIFKLIRICRFLYGDINWEESRFII